MVHLFRLQLSNLMPSPAATPKATAPSTSALLNHALSTSDWSAFRAAAVKKPAASLTALQKLNVLAPDSVAHTPDALLAYAEIAMRVGSRAQSGKALYAASRLLGGVTQLTPPLQNALLRSHPLWYEDAEGLRLRLARPHERHRQALVELFDNQEFRGKYNAFLEAAPVAAQEYIHRSTLPMEQVRQINWVIETKAGQFLGLATIAGLDWKNRTGELVFGFPPGHNNARYTAEAFMLILSLVFRDLRLSKLCSMVYANNPEAQSLTNRMGIEQEGYLRKHIVIPGYPEGIDTYINGMLASDYATNPRVQRHIEVFLPGVDLDRLFVARPVSASF